MKYFLIIGLVPTRTEGWCYTLWPQRRRERNFEALHESFLGRIALNKVIDLSGFEQQNLALEGTGAMVLDHLNMAAYAAVSSRCNPDLFKAWATLMGYDPILFHTEDDGVPVYHANVVMGIQTETAVICSEVITSPDERSMVLDRLTRTGRRVIDITRAQMGQFCGNVLEVRNQDDTRFLSLSQTAFNAFDPTQRRLLGQDKTLLPVDIQTLEKVGGGSDRCTKAEIWLPKA
jgi:hypothetical protein